MKRSVFGFERVAAWGLICVLGGTESARAANQVAQAGMNFAGQPAIARAAGATLPTLTIKTFTGLSAGVQNLVQAGSAPTLAPGTTAYRSDGFAVADPGAGPSLLFGNALNAKDKVYETWSGTVPPITKPTIAMYSLDTQDNAKVLTDFARGVYYPGGAPAAPAGERIVAMMQIVKSAKPAGSAPAGTVAGSRVLDPYPIVAVSGENNANNFASYAYSATIGGTDATDYNNPDVSTPTSLAVDGADESTSMEYFADDSNDPTFNATQSNPIWDFAISLDTLDGAPALEASFSYDPNRLSFGGPAPTADELLDDLLGDDGVTYTTDGVDSASLCINDPTELFSGTYTALDNANSADPNISSEIDFSFGDAAAGTTVPEPSSLGLFCMGGLLLVRKQRGCGMV